MWRIGSALIQQLLDARTSSGLNNPPRDHHHHRYYDGLLVRMLVMVLTIQLSNADNPLTIGIIDGTSYPYPSSSIHSVETMYRLHLQRYANNQILGRPVQFVYETINGSYPMNTIMLKPTVQALIAKYSPDVIICPFQSGGCEDAVTASSVIAFVPAPSSNVVCRSDSPLSSQPPCQVVGTRRYKWVWSVSSSYDLYYNTFLGMLKIKGAKSLAVVGDNSMAVFLPGLTILSRDNHIELKTFQYPSGGFTPQLGLNYTRQVMSYNPDAVIVTANCNSFVLQAQALDYMPKSLAGLSCDPATLGDTFKYITTSTYWDPRLIGSEYTETLNNPAPFYPVSTSPDDHLSPLPSPLQFANDFASFYNRTPVWNEVNPLAALQMWESAIRLANSSTDRVQIATQLNAMYQPSFFGVLSSNGLGVNQQSIPVMLQTDLNNVQQLVAPLSTATSDFVYPAPKWSERSYTFHMYAKKEEIALIAIVSILCAGILVLMMALYRYREHPAVKATTPWISAVMGVGGITASLAILTWPLENNSTTCSARLWMWTLGFHLFIGPLLAKTFRIDRIFNQTRLLQHAGKHISDAQVAAHAILPFLPQLIINIVWYALDTPQATLTVPDPIRPVYNYVDCASDYTYVLAPLSFFYSLLLLIIACYLAYRIRNAYKVFNDTKSIIQCIYIFAVTAIVIGAVQFTVSGQRPVLFLIRSFGVVIAYGASLSILFVSRIRAALQTEADMKKSSLNSGLGINSTLPQDRRDMLRYKAEVDKYKIRVTTLEQLLKENNIPIQFMSDDNTTIKAKAGRSSSMGNGAVASMTGKRGSVVSTTARGPSDNNPVLSLTAAHTSPTHATDAMTGTTVPLVGVEIAGTTGSETVEASNSLSPNRLSFSIVSLDKPRTVRIHTVPSS